MAQQRCGWPARQRHAGGVAADDPAEPEEVPDPVRHRLDEVFGDVLPEITGDEVHDAADDPPSAHEDEWLRVNRPPHHERD